MPSINITNEEKTSNGWTYTVEIDGNTHAVSVSESYWRQLTNGRITPAQLVEISFEFLLEREPSSAILPEFDLRTITKYFSEYEKAMGDLAHDGRF